MGIKKRIHVNQHVIKSNRKNETREAVVTVKTYKANYYGSEVVILGPSKVVYSPYNPMSCGAEVWIETNSDTYVDGELVK